MNGLIYHEKTPNTKKDFYNEFDTLDYDINVGEGRKLVKNSVRLLFDLRVLDNGARNATDIHFDKRCGGHAFISSVQTEFLEGPSPGQKEAINNYARLVSMNDAATIMPEDYMNATQVMELKCYNNEVAIQYSKGRTTVNTGAKLTLDQDCVIKPFCVLNKMSGGDLPFTKSGVIRLSLNLASNRSALCGPALVQGQDSYQLRNPRLHYQSVPDDNSGVQTIMRSVYNIKSSVQSSFASITARVPTIADSVSVSFQRQSREQAVPFSNYNCEEPVGIEEVQFLFNGSTSDYISYKIDSLGEMNQRYINSFVNTGSNQLCSDRFNSNQTFGVGVSFNGYVDLSNSNFTLQMKSKVDNTDPINCYLYFHSMVAV